MDGVLPAGLLKGFLPVVNTGNEVLAPLLGGSRVNVIDNGLDGLYQLSPLLLLYILGTGFQAPAGDEANALHSLLVVGEHAVAIGEVTDARIKVTLLHGRLRKKDHRGIEDYGHHTGLTAGRQGAGTGRAGATGTGAALRLVVAVSLGNGYLGIDGIGTDALDEAGVTLEAAQIELALSAAVEGKHLCVALEKAIHLDAGGSGIGVLLRLEGSYDGILGTYLHGLVYDLVLGREDIQNIGP